MPGESFGELVEVETADRLRLHGFLESRSQQAVGESAGDSGLADSLPDGWIIVHGVAGNFYGSSLLSQLAKTLLRSSQAVVRVNTRGHDLISFTTTAGGQTRTGAAFENLGHSSEDLAAWCQLLKTRGCQRIGIAGHSLGAVKAIFSAASGVPAEAIIAVSPPRFCYDSFLQDSQADLYLETLANAQRLCDAGQPEELIRSRFPFPMQIAAGAYVEKYGPGDRFDFLPLRLKLKIPTLFTFGSLELVPGKNSFHGSPEALRSAGLGTSPSAVEVIENADHPYRTGRASLIACVERWLDSLATG